jgi:hypothetical protein
MAQLRVNMAADGLGPSHLARRRGPAVFVDLVDTGWTFEWLYGFLRRWVDDERAQWDVIRRKLRFIGITSRRHTSPKTWRWYQHADWARELPRSAVVGVSLPSHVMGRLWGTEHKTTVSFRAERWLDESVRHPRRDEPGRRGLAVAVALYRRGAELRDELVTLLAREPQFAEPWLRALALELRR